MKWKKRGLIFDPKEHKLPNNCVEFAQSPQTLVFKDFVRIYFSTREVDKKNGKYLSHIAFVDMDKSFQKILNLSTETVVPLGKLGTFDEHGIFPINPLKIGEKIFAYTCGWSRRVSVSVETSTGLAISENGGLTFKKVGDGPIFSSSLDEPFLVGDSFVVHLNGMFHMWYIYGKSWTEISDEPSPARVYKIAHATSLDGINWTREHRQIIADKLNSEECQALPTVIQIGEMYHMYFCYREATGFRKDKTRGYKIGYAYSKDLISWIRDDEKGGMSVSSSGWDSEMQCYPHIVKSDDSIFLLYNGNEFGRKGFGLAELEHD